MGGVGGLDFSLGGEGFEHPEGGKRTVVQMADGAVGQGRGGPQAEFGQTPAQAPLVVGIIGEFGSESADGDGGGMFDGRVVVRDRKWAGHRVATRGGFPAWFGGVEGETEQTHESGVAIREDPGGCPILPGQAAGQSAKDPSPDRKGIGGAINTGRGDESEHGGKDRMKMEQRDEIAPFNSLMRG